MPRRQTHIDRFTELAVFSYPFRTGNLIFIVVYTLLFTYLTTVWRLMGLSGFVLTFSLTYVVTLFYFGFLFVIVDFSAQGYQVVPKLSKNLLESERLRLFKLVIVFSFFFSLLYTIEADYWRVFIALSCLVTFPLATSVILMEEKLFSALNPVKWFSMLSDIELDAYCYRFLGIEAALILAIYAMLVTEAASGSIGIALVLILLMMAFRALGAVLHHNADALGIPVQFSKDIEESQELRMLEQDIEGKVYELYQLANSGHTADALKQLDTLLSEHSYQYEAIYFSKISQWESPRLAINAGPDYIERLVNSEQYQTALNVLDFCFQSNNGHFTVNSVSTVFKLAEKATNIAERQAAAYLLSTVPDQFPNHPRCVEALLEAARVYSEGLDDFESGASAMRRIAREHPEARKQSEYRHLSRLINAQK